MDGEGSFSSRVPSRAGSAVIRQQSEPTRRIEIVSDDRPSFPHRPESESLYFGASEGLYDLGLDPFSTRVDGKDYVIGAPVLPCRRHLQIAGEVYRLTWP